MERVFFLLSFIVVTQASAGKVVPFPVEKKPSREALRESIVRDFRINPGHAAFKYAEADFPFPSGDVDLDRKIRGAFRSPWDFFDTLPLGRVKPQFIRKVFPELDSVKSWDDLESLLERRDIALENAALFELGQERLRPQPETWRSERLRKLADLYWPRSTSEVGPLYVLLRGIDNEPASSLASPLLERMEKYVAISDDLHRPGWNEFAIRHQGLQLLTEIHAQAPLEKQMILRLARIAARQGGDFSYQFLKTFGRGDFAGDVWREVLARLPEVPKGDFGDDVKLTNLQVQRGKQLDIFSRSSLSVAEEGKILSETLRDSQFVNVNGLMANAPELFFRHSSLLQPEQWEYVLQNYSTFKEHYIKTGTPATLAAFVAALKRQNSEESIPEREGRIWYDRNVRPKLLARADEILERAFARFQKDPNYDKSVFQLVKEISQMDFALKEENQRKLLALARGKNITEYRRELIAKALAGGGGPVREDVQLSVLNLLMDQNPKVHNEVAVKLHRWKWASERVETRAKALLFQSTPGEALLHEIGVAERVRLQRKFIREVCPVSYSFL